MELLLDIWEKFWLFAGELQQTPATEAPGVVFEGLLQPGEHKLLRVSPGCQEAEIKNI